jgi:opacity protein-like surface antigen
VKTLVRAAVLTGICLGAVTPAAHADYIFTPFVGKSFAATSTLSTSSLPVTASVDKQTWIGGVSAAWLTRNILGGELDFGYAPRFFKPDLNNLTRPGSNVVSLTGNLLLAVPLSVTRESLRPYISAGLGMLHAGVSDSGNVATIDRNLLAFSIGGGAIGFLSPRAGVRFDLRTVRSTSTGLNTRTLINEPQLGFWRATVGVAIRY